MDTRIALQVQRPKIVSPADLLSLKDLQTRSQLNQFNLEQAPENARQERELRQAEIDYRKSMALSQIGKQGEGEQERHRKEAVRQATTMLRSPPERRPAIYQGMLQWVASQDPDKAAQMPQQYDDSMLPKFEALVYGEVGADQAAGAEAERQAYPAQPQQVPLSQVGQPAGPLPMTMDAESGAMVGSINPAQPQGVPIAETDMEPVDVTAKAPMETPDSLRTEAKAIEARGGKANYEKAKDLRSRAEKLDDRIFKEREQFIPEPNLGGFFNKMTGKFEADGKELSAQEVMDRMLSRARAGASNLNLFAPQPGVDEKGNSVFFQPNKAGGAPTIVPGVSPKAPEGYNKQKAGVDSVIQSMGAYKNLLTESGGRFDRLSPQKRLQLGTLYNDMMLQAKEAYNLGVLNGPDYMILQEVIKNPLSAESMIYSAEDLKKQVTTFEEVMSRVRKSIDTSYGQKPQPEPTGGGGWKIEKVP